MSTEDTNFDSSSPAEPESQLVSEKDMIATFDSLEQHQVDAPFPELSEQLERDLVQVFKLLADETRLKILMYLLRERELHVSALCAIEPKPTRGEPSSGITASGRIDRIAT